MKRAPASIARASVLALAAFASSGAVGASASGAEVVSANWAGYAAAGPSTHFTRVSGEWTQPVGSCQPGAPSYSAVWLGLGGFNDGSRALEQIGTEADCARSGAPSYSTWLELVPAAPQTLTVKIRPGDHVAASVTVRARKVALHLTDLSTGARFETTRAMGNPDTSSAEWIVEAPSICLGSSSCSTLPLTDFGTVGFARALAQAGGHTGSIADPRWTSTELELRQGASGLRGPGARPRFMGIRKPIAAVPSGLSAAGGSFSVTWGEAPRPEQPNQVVVPDTLAE